MNMLLSHRDCSCVIRIAHWREYSSLQPLHCLQETMMCFGFFIYMSEYLGGVHEYPVSFEPKCVFWYASGFSFSSHIEYPVNAIALLIREGIKASSFLFCNCTM